MPIPVILDIQIGVNIDDLFSLALALCSPEINLVLVTTVSDMDGEGTRRARELVHAFGSDVPVVQGTHQRYAEVTGTLPEAVPALIEAVQDHYEEITIVTNGPLTNVALAIRESTLLQNGIKAMITMAGWTSQRLPEWNIHSDPDAMQVLLAASFPFSLFSMDVTSACRLNELYLNPLKESSVPGTKLLLEYLLEWQKDNPKTPTLHDPLTIAYLCQPELAVMESAYVTLVPSSDGNQHDVLVLGKEGKPASVCSHVDTLGYFNLIIERLTAVESAPQTAPSDWSWIHLSPPPLLYNALELRHDPGWKLDPQSRSEYQVVMLRSGLLTLEVSGSVHLLQSGDLFFIPAEQTFSMETSATTDLIFVYFKLGSASIPSDGHIESWIAQLRNTPFQIPHEYVVPAERAIRELVQTHLQQTIQSTLLSKALLYELLSLLYGSLRRAHHDNLTSQQTEYVEAARRWITANINRSLSLDEMAHAIGVSKYHLSRLFLRKYAMSPGKYHARLRMHKAKSLIEQGHLNVGEIGTHLGYRSVHSFSRAFKAYWGVSPSEFRGDGSGKGRIWQGFREQH